MIKCTECWTDKYMIVASWDWDWFHHWKWKWKVRICDRCFNLLEWWEDIEWYYILNPNRNKALNIKE